MGVAVGSSCIAAIDNSQSPKVAPQPLNVGSPADNVLFVFVAANGWRHCFLGNCSMFLILCPDPGPQPASPRKSWQALQRPVVGELGWELGGGIWEG